LNPHKKKKVASSLTSKGFREQPKKDHHYYQFYYKGQKCPIWTKISHGGGTSIDVGILIQMARQVKLENRDFENLILCPFKEADYIALLLRGKHISDEPN